MKIALSNAPFKFFVMRGQEVMKEANIDELKKVGIIAQNQKDHFLIRLRTVAGDLSADELNIIAQVSREFSDGRVHLTTRQALDI